MQLGNIVKKKNRWQCNVFLGWGRRGEQGGRGCWSVEESMFIVHVSTKSASDQTLSSHSQKNINKLFNANTEGFFPSRRANTDILKQQVKYCGVCVFHKSG